MLAISTMSPTATAIFYGVAFVAAALAAVFAWPTWKEWGFLVAVALAAFFLVAFWDALRVDVDRSTLDRDGALSRRPSYPFPMTGSLPHRVSPGLDVPARTPQDRGHTLLRGPCTHVSHLPHSRQRIEKVAV